MKLFDLDGTLLDSNGIWQEIDRRFLERRGLEWSEAYNEGVIHAIFPTAAQFTKDFCHLEESVEEIMSEWHAMALEGYAHTLEAKEWALEYLAQCAAEGETLALFTSAVPDLCRAALTNRGFDKYLSQVIFAQELGMEKRHPEVFHKAAALLGADPGEITFFDDSPVACRSAKTAGLTVIGVHDPFFADREDEMRSFCDGYIRSFRELIK